MSPVSIEIKDNIAWVTIDNPPVNATSLSVRQGLMDAVSRVQGCKLAVLKCAGRTFIAGGDMTEFDRTPEEPHLPDVLDAIERSETPFLAMMHGTVLGGGFEVAMACAYRHAKPGTRFGLPEVNVGLIPGAGGTQRAPRLLGWEHAFKMACLGELFTVETLLELNAIDHVVEDLDGSIDLVSDIRPQHVSKRDIEPAAQELWAEFDALIKKRSKGQNSPALNLEALKWASEQYSIGQPKERALHLQLRKSDESKALRHIFFAERAASSPTRLKGISPRDIKSVAIVGGGLMGCGIAAACLNANLKVQLIEQNEAAASAANQRIIAILQGGLERGKISQSQFEIRNKALSTADSYDAAQTADLAIEAVFEDMGVKQLVFAELDKVMRKDAILATNTSYLDPDEIFENIEDKSRCAGLHFFSPAHIMKLIEIVALPQTSDETLATSFTLAKSLRKMPVLSGICDGFIGNRILSTYRRAAEYLLADGAYPHEIDKAMRSFGMAMGPFETQDLSGLQIAYANRRRQDQTRSASERYIPIADQLCEMERLGQRAGKGWYAYDEGSRKPIVDEAVNTLIDKYRTSVGITPFSFSEAEIQTLLLTAMANEGARIVEEGIAKSDDCVDVVKVHGYGFPRHKGGPMHWAEKVGIETIKASIAKLESASPGSWVRARIFS